MNSYDVFNQKKWKICPSTSSLNTNMSWKGVEHGRPVVVNQPSTFAGQENQGDYKVFRAIRGWKKKVGIPNVTQTENVSTKLVGYLSGYPVSWHVPWWWFLHQTRLPGQRRLDLLIQRSLFTVKLNSNTLPRHIKDPIISVSKSHRLEVADHQTRPGMVACSTGTGFGFTSKVQEQHHFLICNI